ncbi:MAG: thioredoxin domain-containing protein, partial [Bacteroidota bacterium]
LTSPEGAFYSALDADSEGVEGKYYVWKKEELQTILKDDFNLFTDYFNINERGLWEHDNYILLRNETDEGIALKHNITVEALRSTIDKIKKQLLKIREQRIRPGLDDKTLTSWNALMLKGYVDAFTVFDEPHFLEVALKNVTFILNTQLRTDCGLNHNYKNGKSTINGYLEDYCFTIEALTTMYEATFNELYLHKAHELMDYCILHFQDKESGMFYFTSDEDKALISRKMELSDNVIPASNSSIAKSLFKLGHHFEKEEYITISRKMVNNVMTEIVNYGSGYSNWAMLLLHFTQPFYEIALVGKQVGDKKKAFNKEYLPNILFAGSLTESSLPLLKNRFIANQTPIYICSNKTCHKPVTEVKEALEYFVPNLSI